jgi:hypothetical protein
MDKEKGKLFISKDFCCQIINKLIWIFVSTVFMENRRELYFSELER